MKHEPVLPQPCRPAAPTFRFDLELVGNWQDFAAAEGGTGPQKAKTPLGEAGLSNQTIAGVVGGEATVSVGPL